VTYITNVALTISNIGVNDMLKLARPERFELPTPWFVARYSIQLSYGRGGRAS
jgi:hypothetical protein